MGTPKLTPVAWFWLFWIMQFLGVEFYFLFVNPNGTLSGTVWSLEELNERQPFDFAMWTSVHWSIALTVWLLFGWLSLHLPFGLLR